MALVSGVLVARKRAVTALLCRCGLPGMAVLWLLIKVCPTSWLFALELVDEDEHARSINDRYPRVLGKLGSD